MDQLIRDQFNRILIKHYERLTGSKNAAGGLPLTLDNLGCLILFGGRELEMSDITSDVSDRYTMDEFLQEIKDAGIEKDEYFQTAMQELEERKYIEHRPDGHIHGYQDSKETARILNRIFPKMQGINLLAYIWQTIAEVAGGRTDLESALLRFDQTLDSHGVMPPKPKIPVIAQPSRSQASAPAGTNKEKEINRGKSRIIRDYVVKDASVKNAPSFSKAAGAAPEAPCSEAVKQQTTTAETDRHIQAEKEAMQRRIAELEESLAAAEKEKREDPSEVAPALKEDVKENVPADKIVEGDDEIARKIAEFEKELALVCPLCKTGALQEKSTAAGKVFYACQSQKCNFISWGRPHNIQCIRCKNPFLVEITDAAGQTILRCPRATCQHRQPLNPGTVKFVRKRLVRRKA